MCAIDERHRLFVLIEILHRLFATGVRAFFSSKFRRIQKMRKVPERYSGGEAYIGARTVSIESKKVTKGFDALTTRTMPQTITILFQNMKKKKKCTETRVFNCEIAYMLTISARLFVGTMQTIKNNVFYSVHSAVDGEQKKNRTQNANEKTFSPLSSNGTIGGSETPFTKSNRPQNEYEHTEALPG